MSGIISTEISTGVGDFGSGLSRLRERVQAMRARVGLRNIDKAAILDELRIELVRINQADRLRGVDRYGRPLVPVKSQKGRRGNGPPLAPRGVLSRVVTNYRVEWTLAPGKVTINAGWTPILSTRGIDFLKFHLRGNRTLPKRDIAGITPQGQRKVGAMLVEWIRESLRRP